MAASSGSDPSAFRFPTPANLRPSNEPPPGAGPAAGTVDLVAAASAPRRVVPRFPGMDIFRIDPDLRPALEDMFAGQGRGADWQKWLEQFTNEALRAYLGR